MRYRTLMRKKTGMETACDFKEKAWQLPHEASGICQKSGRTLRQRFESIIRMWSQPLRASRRPCLVRCGLPGRHSVSANHPLPSLGQLTMFRRFIIACALLSPVLLSGCHPAKNNAAPLACIENCHQVTPVLYRSGQPDREGFSALQRAGIRSVLNLREYHSDADKARHTSLCLMNYPMAAGEVTEADVENCLKLIADAPKPVLVHCWHGSDRTGIIIAAYLIVYCNKSVTEAEAVLRDKRFGHHEFWYGNLSNLLHSTDWDAMRQRLKNAPRRQ